MTVSELIAWLQTQPQNARVFEENCGELREIRKDNLSSHEDAIGFPIDEDEYDEEEIEVVRTNPIVIFGAWS